MRRASKTAFLKSTRAKRWEYSFLSLGDSTKLSSFGNLRYCLKWGLALRTRGQIRSRLSASEISQIQNLKKSIYGTLQDLDSRNRGLNTLAQNSGYTSALRSVVPLIIEEDRVLLRPTRCSPMQ